MFGFGRKRTTHKKKATRTRAPSSRERRAKKKAAEARASSSSSSSRTRGKKVTFTFSHAAFERLFERGASTVTATNLHSESTGPEELRAELVPDDMATRGQTGRWIKIRVWD